jgi:hypothetical protein
MNSDQSMEIDTDSAVVNRQSKGKDKEGQDEEISPLQVEATKFGLRVLTKEKWEELRAEYLLYRQELIDEINALQDEDEVGIYRKRGYEMHDKEEQITEEDSNQIRVQNSTYIHSTKNAAVAANDPAAIQPNSAYPSGCLVFVRNVHPDTNKTTLRSLFLHARESCIENGIDCGKKDDDGLDYLDYTKGMNCVCVLFLPIPSCFRLNS